ncbi:MAG TPA: DUF4465 domain-containing protein [Gemmatales bacterium]|nr:DUF4465 domain-containing protein [Gemmatales bacterium]HMP60488.1 DUF4465 domain-containing protein [Gemmatales bacterium]
MGWAHRRGFGGLAALLLLPLGLAAQTTTVDFEDLVLPGPNTYYNGSDQAGGFVSQGAFFNNNYNTTFDVWSGWSYSNVVDVTTPGFLNDLAAYHLPGGGGDGSPNYGVAFNFLVGDARIVLPAGFRPGSVRITNTTYAALSMLQGDSFSKQFGGPTGNDPDFFLLTIQGRDAANGLTGSVEFYLADYRFADNSLDYVIDRWTSVDLSGLSEQTVALTFELTSTDVGPFGMNTPAYFAMDNLVVTAIPEPATLVWLGTASVLGWFGLRRRPRGSSRAG